MIVRQDLQRAIELMQSGEAQAASASLRALIAEPDLDDHARATAYLWLAESRPDRDFKIDCLQRALVCEPQNLQVKEVLDQLQAEAAATQMPPAQSIELQAAPQVVGIRGGPNGPGSGMFVNHQGLIATTGYLTGSADTLSVDIDDEWTVAGQVVRRHPGSDLALIETPVRIGSLGSLAPAMLIARDELIVALAYAGQRAQGLVREVGTGARSQWLLTSLAPGMMLDAGGNPVWDTMGKIVGMLTRNADHVSGSLYALDVGQINRLAEQFLQERRLLPDAGYCGSCGSLTRAHRYGGRYCETCGALLPESEASATVSPEPERLNRIYDGNESQACPVCAAQVGFYADRCLRCGRELTRQSRGFEALT